MVEKYNNIKNLVHQKLLINRLHVFEFRFVPSYLYRGIVNVNNNLRKRLFTHKYLPILNCYNMKTVIRS